MKSIPFLKSKTAKLQAFAGVVVLCGGLVMAAHGGVDPAHIHLKMADAGEGGARVTMASAAKAAMPSVVKISASKIVKTPAAFSGDQNDLFRQFFGGRNGAVEDAGTFLAHRAGSGLVTGSTACGVSSCVTIDRISAAMASSPCRALTTWQRAGSFAAMSR